MYTPTSVELSRMLQRADGSLVPVAWLMEQLGPRSFGLTFFVMGLVALVPGASIFVGVMLAWPAVQLMTGQDAAKLPRFVGRRTVEVERLVRVIGLVAPRLARLETLVRPRWSDLFVRLRRLTGLAMLLLGLAMVSPLPFSHVLPALVIMLLALAYLEDDGLVLLIALVGALGTLAVTAATVWGAVATIDWLDPAAGAAAAGMVSIGSAGLRPACRADRVERSPAETNGPPAAERRRRRPGRRRAPALMRGVRHEP